MVCVRPCRKPQDRFSHDAAQNLIILPSYWAYVILNPALLVTESEKNASLAISLKVVNIVFVATPQSTSAVSS